MEIKAEQLRVTYTIPDGLSDDLELRHLFQAVISHGTKLMSKEIVQTIMEQEAQAIEKKIEL